MRTRSARYLKADKWHLYSDGVVLRDPMLAEPDAPAPTVFTGTLKRAQQWCRDTGFFFNSPFKV